MQLVYLVITIIYNLLIIFILVDPLRQFFFKKILFVELEETICSSLSIQDIRAFEEDELVNLLGLLLPKLNARIILFMVQKLKLI